MKEYQVLARKYRPQVFREVLGQDAIVTTLKNAIKFNRLAHAYLFCGSRGTGKTTLARIFAKALNCQQPSEDFEPCGHCASCKEITSGHSLDVLEIDGASHRGIEDIRQINETVGYTPSSGKYKIYIIDEVHMLTKEAFNALLKTLEEPPAKVKFFFATTEPHKVLPTILSRCQRFNLNRISTEKIAQKLTTIAKEQGYLVDEESVQLIAARADGGLRDAESLLDQILAFTDGNVTLTTVTSVLGLMPRDIYFEIDRAGKEGNLAKAFEIAHQVFSEGKDLLHFVEGFLEHFRNILLIKISGPKTSLLSLSSSERERYIDSTQMYTQEQCTSILDIILESQNQIRFAPSGKIALEALILKVMRTRYRIPIDLLVQRLSEMEQALFQVTSLPPVNQTIDQITTGKPEEFQNPIKPPISLLSEDPTPASSDLGRQAETFNKNPSILDPERIANPVKNNPPSEAPHKESEVNKPQQPTDRPNTLRKQDTKDPGQKPTTEVKQIPKQKQGQFDTLLQFAAVELEGKIQKNR